MLLDVPPEVWDRIRTHARARLEHPTGPTDSEIVFGDALNEYVGMDSIVVVDGEVKNITHVFDEDALGATDDEPWGRDP